MAYAEKLVKSWRARWEVPGRTASGAPKTDGKSGFPTKAAALRHAREQEHKINEGTWTDPKAGRSTWTQWWTTWLSGIDVEPGTEDFYTTLWSTHIEPRWGNIALADVRGPDVIAWLKGLRDGTVETGPAHRRRTRAYSGRTTEAIRKQMSLMLDDAVKARMIGANALKTEVPTRNRGKRSARMQPATRPKLHIASDQVLAIAVNIEPIGGIGAFMRVLISAWTGIRSGESAALLRDHVLDNPPRIVVDDLEGALKQTRLAGITRGTPKGGIGRTATLSASPAALLKAWLDFSKAAEVFPGPVVNRKAGDPQIPTWTRDTWKHRWRVACDGKHDLKREGRKFVELDTWAVEPVLPGLEFKGLRRAHNVWLTEADVPEVARAHRLGHAMNDEMQAAYSLVSDVMESRVLEALEVFWAKAFRGSAGSAAVEIISRFAPDLARAYEKALPGEPGKGLWPAI